MLFVDTSAFVALAILKDDHHKEAAAFLDSLAPGHPMVTSDDVFDETVTRLRQKAGHAVALEVGEALRTSTVVRVVRLEAADREQAWKLFQEEADRDLSLTDCTSLVLMRRLGVREVFTFDEDFLDVPDVRALPPPSRPRRG